MQTSTTQQRKRGLCALLLSSAVLTLAVLRLHRSCRRTLAPRASSDGASRPQAAGRNVGHRAAVTDRMYDGALHTNYVRSLQLLDPEVWLAAKADRCRAGVTPSNLLSDHCG